MGKWEDLEDEMASMSFSERNKLLAELNYSLLLHRLSHKRAMPWGGKADPVLFSREV